MRKKIFMFLLAICMIVPCGFALSGCGDNNPPVHTLNVKNAYAMSAIAGATYLSDAQAQGATVAATAAAEAPVPTTAELGKFNEYMQMFEGYLLTGSTNVTTSQAQEEDYGQIGDTYVVNEHTIKQTITVPMLDKKNTTFTIYYTEKNGSTYVEADDADETEVHAQLSGVVVLNDDKTNYYTLEGTRTTETSNNEYECEISFFIKKDANNFVKMQYSNEIELNETEDEFEISIYENNDLVSSTEISFEKENGEIKMELEFNEDVTAADHAIYTIKHQKVENGAETKDVFKVWYKTAQNNGSFTVECQDATTYNYVFGPGASQTMPR